MECKFLDFHPIVFGPHSIIYRSSANALFVSSDVPSLLDEPSPTHVLSFSYVLKLLFLPVPYGLIFGLTKKNNSLSKEFLRLCLVQESNRQHYPRSIYRALLQLQFLSIVLNVVLTKVHFRHPSDS